MHSNKRVFITGISALASTGLTAEKVWDSLVEGKTGIDEITSYDLKNWQYRLGGELKDFQAAKMLPDRKLLKVISKHDAYGIQAAVQAIENSQIINYRENLDSKDEFNDRTAVYVGSPGNKYFQQHDFLPLLAKTGKDMKQFAKQLFDIVHPMWLLRILPNNVLAYTGITYGLKGPNHNITNHAVGGMQALIEAYHAIKTGQAERAVVVAYDLATEPQALFYYAQLGVISSSHLKPFDQKHNGTILAEGAAALVLESEESVKKRTATCYAEVCGGFSATEHNGLFTINEQGNALAEVIKSALAYENIQNSDVGLIVAHGNGNKKSDISEAQAINQVFKEVPVTAYKWSMGHTVCASGVLDTVLTTLAYKNRCIPGIANLDNPAKECGNLNVSTNHRTLDNNKPYSVIINRGFASINAALVMRACE
ncbi:3-oxoacyl-ACP synthase [Legionella adelaidensis]|uniref:3-oxoacyl-ACP synthase n=1 Tax=Legionella adelaidensis TaxID=45056 RepID=A0A0W0R2M8_9GAMM|nr:beta-ketoacyl synthase N-terminal-like domain-containing protein [Legionella adelaidensis]KTC65243.1 3-oxoacyl-ACP synthase [Legionella adelaidensis]